MANNTGKKFGGRVKGTPNRQTTKVKEAIIEAFEKLGGVDYLVKLGKSDPKTFALLLGKVLPLEIKAGIDTGFFVKKIERVMVSTATKEANALIHSDSKSI